MRYRKLPTALKLKVHEYYYQRYHGHLFDEEQILKELSHALKEVMCNIYMYLQKLSKYGHP